LTALDLSNNTALTHLHCGNNQLTSLDVRHLAALAFLDNSINPLTMLDVSNNTALTTLWCYSNRLPELNVSNNRLLTALHCNNNQLESLDLSQNTRLTTLECNRNQLAALDLSRLPGLSILNCGNNRLKALDVSQNTGLTRLYCDFNLLEELDVSKNALLERLDCSENPLFFLDVSHNASLERFSCNANQLEALELSKNTALQQLRCNENLLTALDVSHNIKLTELYCQNNYLALPDSVKGWQEIGLAINSPNNLYSGTFRFYMQHTSPRVVIRAHPRSVSFVEGAISGSLSVTAVVVPSGEPSYQWYSNTQAVSSGGTLIPGATNPAFTIPVNLTANGSPYYYYCVVSAPEAASVASYFAEVTIARLWNGAILYQTSAIPATVALYDSTSKLITSTTTIADGTYTLNASAGTEYTLVVTKPGYLSYTIKNLTLTEGASIETIDIRQLAGDVNGDGIVNAVDLTYLLSEFNRVPVIHEHADIDGNGIVNAADLTYLLAGFNKQNVVVYD
jgi:Leucine-rich repeat (LRR) protein